MKVQQIKDFKERDVLIGMLTSKTVLSRIASRWSTEGLFASKHANLVGNWCVEHWKKYGKPPNRAIRSYFEDHAEKIQDEEILRPIEKLLSHLSDLHENQEKVNPEHLLDIAGKLFRQTKIAKSIEQSQIQLDAGNIDRAEKVFLDYNRVEMGQGSGIDVFTDEDAMRFTDSESNDPLFTYPGALGHFFHRLLQRDIFLAFQGGEKSGKTYLMMDMAFRAMLCRRRVGFFSVGDMTENQVKERLYARAAEHPYESDDGKWPYTIKIPTSITYKNRDWDEKVKPMAKVQYQEKTFKHGLNTEVIKKACQRLREDRIKSNKSYLRVSCHPNDSITALGVRDIVDSWANQNFPVDVLVIDYSDVLLPLNSRHDPRDQIDGTWKKLRAMSQELHCLLITGTQATRDSYEKYLQDKRDASGDKRKNAHVDAICAINATAQEKEQGIFRLNFPVHRRRKMSQRQQIHVAGCLDICDPCIVSCY